MKISRQIAIDGVAGSGKSTVGKYLANKLGCDFIDSGLLYRLATLILCNLRSFSADSIVIRNHAENERPEWISLFKEANISVDKGNLYINGKLVEPEKLHSKDVDELVSPVSTVKEIREFITDSLQKIAEEKDIVIVGRDIGTVVLPNAFLKVYLTATDEERASRRFKELIAKGAEVTYSDILANIRERDSIDSSREHSPLSVAPDAYVIDTTNLKVEEVIERIMTLLEGREYALRNTAHTW